MTPTLHHSASARTRSSARAVLTCSLAITLLLTACGKSEAPKAPAAPAAPSSSTAPSTPSSTPATTPAPSTPAPSSEGAAAGSSAGSAAAPPSSPAAPAGWYAVYSGPGKSGNAEVRTHATYASFAIAPGETIEPSLTEKGWTAAYSGVIEIEEPGNYRFMVETEGGGARLSISDVNTNELGRGKSTTPGKTMTDWIKLPAGKVQISVRFTHGEGGTSPKGARLRTLWEMERGSMGTGFYPEPIPTARVAAPKFGASFAAAGYAALQGRILLGELGCAHCHAPADSSASVAAASHSHAHGEGAHDHTAHASTTSLTRVGPTLGEIGRRANPHWLREWITDPHKVRPGTHMPDVIGTSEKDLADADAIVHFLVAPYYDQAHFTQAVATETEVLARGRELYHTVGCIQCHGAFESPLAVFGETGQSNDVPKSKVPLPHGRIGGKWNPAELAAFLKDPLKTRPSGRMPSLNLSDEEADLLATYLITKWPDENKEAHAAAFTVDPAKAEAGKAAFAARGCADCHAMGGNVAEIKSTTKAPALAALTGQAALRGCLDAASTTTPRFELSDNDRAALRAGIEASLRGTGVPAPLDTEARTVAALNCRACHTLDGSGGVPSSLRPYLRTVVEIDLGDEGRVPPHINLVGWKLTTQWMREVFTEAGRARPYMATRMPQFGAANVGELPAQLGSLAGVWPDSDTADPASSDDTLVAGRQLVGDGGLNCISCHAFGSLPPAGAPGPNISDFAARLRLDWWRTYALGPARQKPGTRMPAFFATGKSTKTDILGGDPQKQIEAMWAYFNMGSFAPTPSGVQTGKGLALAVGDKPRIFRTFMKDAGSRGIAVGFPVGTHFGYDATNARLVDAWKGDFIDASGAWANRGGMTAGGQGKVIWKAPEGPSLLIAQAPPATWPTKFSPDIKPRFGGYRLDDQGVPTFLYSLGAAQVEETFTPSAGGIRRTFKLTGVPEGFKVFCNAGPAAMLENAPGVTLDGQTITAIPSAGATQFSVTIKPS